MLALTGLAGVWWFATRPHLASTIGCLMGSALAAWGVYRILDSLRARIVLYPDGLRVQGFLHHRSILRENLLAWRRTGMVFCHSGGTIQAGYEYAPDEEFERWMEGIPELDRRDALEPWRLESDDPEWGSDEKCLAATQRLRLQCAVAMPIVVAAMAVWALLDRGPVPRAAIPLVVAPFLAVAAAALSRGRIRIDGLMIGLSLSMVGPAFANRFYMLKSEESLVWLPLFAGLLWFSAQLADGYSRGTRKPEFGVLLFLGSALYGLLTPPVLNAALDRSAIRERNVQVVRKYAVRGSKGSVFYDLELYPEGYPPIGRVGVSRSFYDSVSQGDWLYLDLQEGALRIAWFAMRRYDAK